MVWYYYVCKRQVWLIAHQLDPNSEDDNLEYGRFLHQHAYKREKKEISIGHAVVNVNPKGDHRANQNGTHPEHHARHWSPAPSGAGRDNSDISQPTAHATAASRGIGTTPR